MDKAKEPWTSKHIRWLVKTNNSIVATDGKKIELWEFHHERDETILSDWAKHFRNHYCLDSEIDYFRKGPNLSRAEYLNTIKFPDSKIDFGPSTRAGDFGEILVADFLEYLLNYWVPRTRYGNKTTRNESTRGTDIIGFRITEKGSKSSKDELVIFEIKTHFSRTIAKKGALQNAIDDSVKDIIRKAESLNAIKQRLYECKKFDDAEKVERFQNEADNPYKEVYGAAALFESSLFNDSLISSVDPSSHPHSENLMLIAIKGKDMMELVHELYRRAADEA